MVVKRRKLRTVSNMFICNLAAADIAVLTFVIPMTIIVSCYTRICGHLSLSTRLDHVTSSRQRSERNKKVIKMLVVIAAVYALFTLPYHVTWLLGVFGYPNSVAKKLCVLLVIATSAAHPIIYGTLNQDFGKGFKAFFRCVKKGKTHQKTLDEMRVKDRLPNNMLKRVYLVKYKETREGTEFATSEAIVMERVSCL
ncbi:hypothetical protein ACROYT_G020667 [Oculina patagonica]